MNREITIYELLGLIKDDKAPKKIKYRGEYWYWGYDTYTRLEYLNTSPDNQPSLFSLYRIDYCLDDEVEIIEEPEELEEIEIENDNTSHFYIRDKHGTRCQMTKHSKIIAEKVNEIIRYIKDKENK